MGRSQGRQVSGRVEDGSVKGDGSVLRCDWLHRFFPLHSSLPLPSLNTPTSSPGRLSIAFPFGSYHQGSGLLIHVKHGFPLSPPLPLLSSAPHGVPPFPKHLVNTHSTPLAFRKHLSVGFA
ncbi:hypothetical protein E2C01_091314 [Portunus trituberculatus]|uniref:Uncharacterized protein n=1 Tax=Portunus trituberculatus TaxID=210409 RepID=A0A5B7JSF3_PORTR|nr:hypothetical protein [Portunus trituberculatus]